MAYVATVNVPGYLPMDDDPPVFDTAAEAWQYLADERRESEANSPDGLSEWSETVDALDARASEAERSASLFPELAAGLGTVYGDTPGYDGSHDLGLAYSVTWTDVVIVDSVQVDIGAVVRAAVDYRPRGTYDAPRLVQ